MFHVGDLVKIVNAQAGIMSMQKMIGEEVRIVGGARDCWILERNSFAWIDKWLEPVSEKEIKISEEEVFKLLGD